MSSSSANPSGSYFDFFDGDSDFIALFYDLRDFYDFPSFDFSVNISVYCLSTSPLEFLDLAVAYDFYPPLIELFNPDLTDFL